MRTLLLVATLLIGGHAWADDENDVVESNPFCQSVINAIGATPEETIEKLGKPLAREATPVENPHVPDAKDNLTVLRYPDGRVSFSYSSYDDQYLLLAASLPSALFSDELRQLVPATIEEVINKWGEADETTAGYSRYYCTVESVEWVDVRTKSGRVTGVAYTGYID